MAEFSVERTIGSWETWFAWRPVRLSDGAWAWWRQIQRRQYSIFMRGKHGPMWESWHQYSESSEGA